MAYIFKDYSTEEDDGLNDKAELVTLKYSSSYSSHTNIKQEPEQNWIPLDFLNTNDQNSSEIKKSLYCKSMENILKVEFNQDEFIQKLINST